MSVVNLDYVDYISDELKEVYITLVITDDLDWIDIYSHLKILERKIEYYSNLIKDGEIPKKFPKYDSTLKYRILVFLKETLPERAESTIKKFKDFLINYHIELDIEVAK